MMKKRVSVHNNKIFHKFNKILWPVYAYLLIMALYYLISDYFYFDFFGLELFVANLVILILPLVLLIWLIVLFRKNKVKNLWFLFLLSLIPGFLFGLQVAYGLYTMGHGDDPIGAILPFTIIALFFGLISGLLGMFINFLINQFKKLK